MQSLRDDKQFLSMYYAKGDCFPNLLARATYLTHYSRAETWTDTVLRVVDANCSLDPTVTLHERKQLFHLFWTMQALPPGRGLWVGGMPNIPADASQNCWNTTIYDTDEWGWVTNQLMLGGGVGVNLSEVHNLPTVVADNPIEPARFRAYIDSKHKNYQDVKDAVGGELSDWPPSWFMKIPDSRQGWVDAVKKTLRAAMSGDSIAWNFSDIRPDGELIRTFGGIAAGPGPLAVLLYEAYKIIRGAAGRKLTTVEALDITNHVGLCVKSGNVRRCLPGETLVHTKSGLRPIRDIKVGEAVLTSGQRGEKFMPVTGWVEQGPQRLVSIKTLMGEFRCTPNHRMAVFNSTNTYTFKTADSLETGDRLVFVDQVLPGHVTAMPSWSYEKVEHSTTCVDISIPKLSTDTAWFLGYFLGNGYVYANRKDNGFNAYVSVCLPNNQYHDGLVPRVRAGLASFGVRTSEHEPSTDDDSRRVIATSKQLAWYFDTNFKQPKTTLKVPTCILEGTIELRSAFLAGLLDSDGAANNRPVVLCTSVYPEFLNELQAVYASLGIPTRLSMNRPTKGKGKALHHLNLVGTEATKQFVKLVQPYAVKQIRQSEGSQRDYGYPSTFVKEAMPSTQWRGAWQADESQMVQSTFKRLGGDTRSLTPITVLDVVETGEVVNTYDIEVAGAEEFVAGGYLVHNSAILTAGNPDDQPFRDAKKDETAIMSHRFTSNNSIAFTNFKQFDNFDWASLVEDNMNFGDPGIMNLALARIHDPEVTGVNPCQPANATVLTPQGIRTFADIDVGSVIWSGKQWTKVVRKFYTGEKEVIRYQTTAGVFLGTANHKVIQEGERIEAGDAESIDLCTGPVYPEAIAFDRQAIVDGWVIGDGTVHKASNNLVCLVVGGKDSGFLDQFQDFCLQDRSEIKQGYWEVKTSIQHYELPKTYERSIPDRFKFGERRMVVSFLRGLYAANGSVCGGRVTLKASSYQIICDVQEMLSSLGISSYYTTNKPTEVEFQNGTYLCKQSYDLQISTGREDFLRLIGFVHKYKEERLVESTRKLSGRRKQSFEIISRQSEGVQPVWDITVEADEHTYWTGGLLVSNCGEIFLLDRESCNLCEIFPARVFSQGGDIRQALILIARYAFRQRLMAFEDEKTEKTRQRKMRVGVGLGGVCDFQHTAQDLRKWYQVVRDTCDRYANELHVNRPIAVTTVKPSGTLSLLNGSSPGMHAPFAEHYIRRIIIPKDTAIAHALEEANVISEPVAYGNAKNTLVFSFPMHNPNPKVTVQNETVKDQFERQLLLQQNWADNSVSATISFEKEEKDLMTKLMEHYIPQLKSSSFLTRAHGYVQAPYEEISKNTFEKMSNNINHDHRLVHSNADDMDMSDCAGGACPIR